jgi:hypothetical protein
MGKMRATKAHHSQTHCETGYPLLYQKWPRKERATERLCCMCPGQGSKALGPMLAFNWRLLLR